MTIDEAAKFKAFATLFPYELLWENSASNWVELSDLKEALPAFEARFAVMHDLGEQRFEVTRDQLRLLVWPLQLPQVLAEELVETAFLLSGWQLAREHQLVLEKGFGETVKTLSAVQRAASRLSGALNDLSPDALRYLGDRIARSPEDPMSAIETLETRSRRIAENLEDLLPGLSRPKGRTADMVLAITVHHLVSALECATGRQVEFRRGKADDRSSLSGQLGDFLLAYFNLFPDVHEASLVRLIKKQSKAARPAKP
jgi:hypothetical protein